MILTVDVVIYRPYSVLLNGCFKKYLNIWSNLSRGEINSIIEKLNILCNSQNLCKARERERWWWWWWWWWEHSPWKKSNYNLRWDALNLAIPVTLTHWGWHNANRKLIFNVSSEVSLWLKSFSWKYLLLIEYESLNELRISYKINVTFKIVFASLSLPSPQHRQVFHCNILYESLGYWNWNL